MKRSARRFAPPSYSVVTRTCPHCKCEARARSSEQLTPLTKLIWYQCRNLDCGHTFRATEEITHSISPSAMPDPAINLPMGKGVAK